MKSRSSLALNVPRFGVPPSGGQGLGIPKSVFISVNPWSCSASKESVHEGLFFQAVDPLFLNPAAFIQQEVRFNLLPHFTQRFVVSRAQIFNLQKIANISGFNNAASVAGFERKS